jgi:hypothetical protein
VVPVVAIGVEVLPGGVVAGAGLDPGVGVAGDEVKPGEVVAGAAEVACVAAVTGTAVGTGALVGNAETGPTVAGTAGVAL